jgi:hypothetical protein
MICARVAKLTVFPATVTASDLSYPIPEYSTIIRGPFQKIMYLEAEVHYRNPNAILWQWSEVLQILSIGIYPILIGWFGNRVGMASLGVKRPAAKGISKVHNLVSKALAIEFSSGPHPPSFNCCNLVSSHSYSLTMNLHHSERRVQNYS